ncbi:hypothetical protein ABPG75_003660 [Micractinium tetrahymenae]
MQEFGQNKVQTMVGKAPILFAVDISVWQTALTVMALCGLTRQAVLKAAHSNANVLRFNWLAAERLVNRLALQRCLPGGLSAGQVYERHAGYLAGTSAEKLAGRLLFLQHHGLLHLLVEKKGPARRQWRRQRGLPANRRAPGEPPLISLHDVSRPDARFASLPVVDEAGGLPALRAFQRGLKSSSAWLELQAAAEAEQVRLLPLLPEHLRQAALGGMAVAVEQEEEEEEAFEDIPEEYEDPLLGGVMRDPVRLPSGNVVERSSIAQQLLTDPRDPYTASGARRTTWCRCRSSRPGLRRGWRSSAASACRAEAGGCAMLLQPCDGLHRTCRACARPAALFARSRPPAARSAPPQALRRTSGARWRRRSSTSSGSSARDEQVFGRDRTLEMVDRAPILLVVGSSVWQTALAVMQLCGLTWDDVLKVARLNPSVLCCDWLEADRLVNRLALQRCLPGGLSAGQVYKEHAGYSVMYGTKRLAGRLLFLQHHGLLHLLVPEKEGLLEDWRQQRGLPANRRSPGEPPLISLRDVCVLTDGQFASLPAVAAAGGLPALQAFMAGLKVNPAWQQLQAAAEAEVARLLALLPQDVRQAAEKRQQVAEEGEEEE